MNILEAKPYVESFRASNVVRQNITPDETIKLISEQTNISAGDEWQYVGTPRLGYIASNIKGVYFIIYCDSCEAKCRKAYPTVLNINNNKILKFLCGKCAGKKYERKKEYEKRALEYLLNPHKLAYVNYGNMSLKQNLAILEAGFMEEKIRERAERNVMKYLNMNTGKQHS